MTVLWRGLAFERGTLWVMEGQAGGDALPRVSPRIPARFEELSPGAAAALAAALGLPDAGFVLRRIASGRRGFVAWVEGRIAACGWVSYGVECIGELEREIHIPAGEAYVWDCVTLPAYRNRRVHTALLSHLAAGLLAEGRRRIWIGSSLGNRPSIGGFAGAGFRPVIRLVYLRAAGLRFLRLVGDPTAPDALVAAARRMLTTERERAWGPLVVEYSWPRPTAACAQSEAS